MRRINCGLLGILVLLLGGVGAAFGQIDPMERKLIQLGYYQPLQGASPTAAYAFYYVNEPHFPETNMTLRLAIAPVYVDTELGFLGLLGDYTDLGVGIVGGGYANSYYDFERGRYFPDQSFNGHGGGFDVSVYHLFNPGQRIPLSGVFRLTPYYTAYAPTTDTSPGFVLPPNNGSLSIRAGFRFGGQEPLVRPDLAMELSAWYEGRIRSTSAEYGFHDNLEFEQAPQLFWARALLNYTFPENKHRLGVSVNAGTSINADRLSAYRLGGDLPLTSEFPLLLPGYFFQELSGKQFVSLNGDYTLPIDPGRRWTLTFSGAMADIDYIKGLEQPENFQAGVGLGIGYRSRSGRWQVLGGAGYGFNAIRTHGNGAESIGILCQLDLEAKRRESSVLEPAAPDKWRNLFPMLQNFF